MHALGLKMLCDRAIDRFCLFHSRIPFVFLIPYRRNTRAQNLAKDAWQDLLADSYHRNADLTPYAKLLRRLNPTNAVTLAFMDLLQSLASTNEMSMRNKDLDNHACPRSQLSLCYRQRQTLTNTGPRQTDSTTYCGQRVNPFVASQGDRNLTS